MSDAAKYYWWVPKRSVSDELLKQIGRRLQWLREAMGQTQSDWARALHVSNYQLNKWEAGTRLPNIDALVNIVLSTRASFDYLFLARLTDEMHPELRERLFRDHGDELELRVRPPHLPPSGPPSPPRPRRRRKVDGNPGRQSVGT